MVDGCFASKVGWLLAGVFLFIDYGTGRLKGGKVHSWTLPLVPSVKTSSPQAHTPQALIRVLLLRNLAITTEYY